MNTLGPWGARMLAAGLAGMFWVVGGTGLLADPPRQSPKPHPTREVTFKGYRVRLDLSGQVLGLSIPTDQTISDSKDKGAEKLRLVPVLSKLMSEDHFVSGSMLAQKAKQFDDGLYAAVELAAERGQGSFPGKAMLLQSLAKALMEPSEPVGPTAAVILAAAELGKLDITLSTPARQPVQEQMKAFRKDELHSKPISFYTWNRSLTSIFQQDRLLQTDLADLKDDPGIEKLARALHADDRARAAYQAYLELVSRLTNPFPTEYHDLRPLLAGLDHGAVKVPQDKLCFFPPSQAHETELAKKLYNGRPIPKGSNLADEMIRHLRAGKLTLQPTQRSGWYDYQTWALEPLVIPEKMAEAKHLKLDPSYTRQLLQLFKGIHALTRETHIKQLEIPIIATLSLEREEVINVSPQLTVEPLASYYLRRAQSYVFIRHVLEKAFGSSGLEQMHRLTAAGPVKPSLARELHDMEALFHGAYARVCRQLGMTPLPLPGEDQGSEAAFTEWQKHLDRDVDLGQDARMMVPLFYDPDRRATKVWVFLGWTARPVEVRFEKQPSARVLTQAGKPVTGKKPRLVFDSEMHTLAYPVTAEVYVTRILNRDEMRRLCDRYKTQSAILAHLR